MAYQTYTTEALVCGTWVKNTSDKSYLLFTKSAGMLYADARSVREEKSKQRYSLQDFSHVKVSLVKGKAGWKIGSVESQQNHYTEAADKAARGSVVNVFRFLRRFYKGEEAAPDLFSYIATALSVLTQEQPEREKLEQVTKLRILADLGYVDRKKLPPAVAADSVSSVSIVSDYEMKVIEKLLEHATNSSQL